MPKSTVKCSQCSKPLNRWLINPNTKKPIANFFCDTACKGQWQIEKREALGFTKEWLEKEYVILGKSAVQIGLEVGRDAKSVWSWLSMYGIQTRPRGHDTRHLPKDGSVWVGRTHSNETKSKMSQKALEDGRVPWGKNNQHPLKNGKPEDHPNYKGGLTPERQSFYASTEWSKVVKAVWARDNAICQRCGIRHNTDTSRGTFHIHHIVSFMVRELRANLGNLVLLCKDCHRWVHGKSNKTKLFIKDEK
jgi:5-methylcytosine-specific restriction endonuclease McrA